MLRDLRYLFLLGALFSTNVLASPKQDVANRLYGDMSYMPFPRYYNCSDNELLIPDFPNLKTERLNQVDVFDVCFSNRLSLSGSTYTKLDSLIHNDVFRDLFSYPGLMCLTSERKPTIQVYSRRIIIRHGVDSYLVYVENSWKYVFLVNMVNNRLKSIACISCLHNSCHQYASLSKGKIDLFRESGHRMNMNSYAPYSHVSKFRLCKDGKLLPIRNYCILYNENDMISSGKVTYAEFFKLREKEDSLSAIKYENFFNETVFLSEMPRVRRIALTRKKRIDVSDIQATPLSFLVGNVKRELGLRLRGAYWESYDYYLLNKSYEHNGITTYYVLLVSHGLPHRLAEYMVNTRNNRLTSIINVSDNNVSGENNDNRYSIVSKDRVSMIDFVDNTTQITNYHINENGFIVLAQ